MTTVSNKLLLCRSAFSRLTAPSFNGGSVVGQLEASQSNCNLVAQLAKEDLIYSARNFANPVPERYFEVELIVPRTADCFFAASLQDLLESQWASHHTAPAEIYLANTNEVCAPSSEPNSQLTKAYFQVLKAVSLLRKTADYEDSSTGTLKLVFLQREKLEVSVLYDVKDIRPLEKVDEWLALLSGDIHGEQRRIIFRTVFLEAMKGVDPVDRFARYLVIFDELFERFRDNYELYVAEFSFEKVLREITEKKLDYVLKLNKTFSDIQNQLLAIPLAVVLVGGQMEPVGTLGVKNFVVFFGVLVFSILMSLLLRNQRDSVAAISAEIEDLKSQFKNKSSARANRFEEAYVDLKRRERRQRFLIWAVEFLVTVALAGTTVIFFQYSGLWDALSKVFV